MPRYNYTAKNKITLQDSNGILEASSLAEAEKILHEKNLVIILLKEEKKRLFETNFLRRGISLEDQVIFFRQMATLIDSGINLVAALEILREQQENKSFKNIIAQIYNDITAGKSFCDSVARYPKVFSAFCINMIRSGEASGMLNDILERLATYLEKAQSLRRKVISSLIYPAVIIVMAFSITALLLLKVVPTFKGIFESLGGKLPLPTQILILVSDYFRRFFFFLVIVFITGAFLIKRYINTPKGRRKLDKALLMLPVFGSLFLKFSVARFTRAFSTLIKSGVPILNSLEIVAKTSGNKIIEETLDEAQVAIRHGEPIHQPLERAKIFPPMVVKMIAVGEKSGELEKMLSKIAIFYEEQVDAAVSGLASIIEPVVIAFLGVFIGGIVIALFLPIFKISELIAQ